MYIYSGFVSLIILLMPRILVGELFIYSSILVRKLGFTYKPANRMNCTYCAIILYILCTSGQFCWSVKG